MHFKLTHALGISLVLYLFGFLSLSLIAKDKAFSELENRNLASLPAISAESILDGSYQESLEVYIADQFPLRSQFVALKSTSEYLLQKKENNGVFIGADNYFLQNFEAPNMELAEKNAAYINTLAQELNVYMLLAPTATKILEDKLPAFAAPYDEGAYINDFKSLLSNNVNFVPVLETLSSHRLEEIYYKTDHHWTTLGAYYAYTSFAEAASLSVMPLEDFTRETLTTEFLGTLFSKGNFSYAEPDSIEIFKNNTSQNLEVTYIADNITTDTLYAPSHLETKDKYSFFLDGNHPLITIKTDADNGKKLLIVKDSYANSLIPFLTPYYEEIHIMDLRLLTMPVLSYAKENNLSDVLLLYNVQNFSAESKLSLLTK